MIYLDIILLSIAVAILLFTIIQIRKMKSVEYNKVLLSAEYGVKGIQTIDVTAILESIGSNTVVHNHHFDPEDKLLPGTEKYFYLTYALATKEILMEGDNVGEFDIVERVEDDEIDKVKNQYPHDTVLVAVEDLEILFGLTGWVEFPYPVRSIKLINDVNYPTIDKPYKVTRESV